MNKFINSLKILRGLKSDGLFLAMSEHYSSPSLETKNDILFQAYKHNAEDGLSEYVQSLILYDENAFSVQCVKGGAPSDKLKKAFSDDLENIGLMLTSVLKGLYLERGKNLSLFEGDNQQICENLADFYKNNGCGMFAKYSAFVYEDGEIKPVLSPVGKKLASLKDYADEKKAIINNVSDFINGLPYSHMLLYGDRGTGKSSTVHALLDEFKGSQLRLIEVEKDSLKDIKKIRESVAALPLKFIIFTDDLAMDGDDSALSSLKAAIEGSVINGANTMICATSNRRHIVSENFSERQNSVHPSDLAEEQLSLSDRFGLTVIFPSTDKPKYLSIVRQLAEDFKLQIPGSELEALAERWAIVKGGRSPRRAEQFVNFVYSCEQTGRPIEF